MISVVIITRNRRDELRKTILSCLEQEAVCEFVIVDNNSDDGTRESVESLAAEHSFELNYLFMEENLGVAGARNVGFEHSSGEIVYFIDDDAWIDDRPDSFRRIEELMSSRPDIAIVSTEIFNVQDNAYQYGIFPRGVPPRTKGDVLYFIGCSHFIRRSPFAGARLYPHRLFFEQEERYASFRAWSLGCRVWYVNSPRVIHAPSTFTRIPERSRSLNNYLNSFIIKKLLCPGCLLPVVWLMFLARMLRFAGLDIGAWKTCISLYRDRYRSADRRPMPLKTAVELVRRFGISPVL